MEQPPCTTILLVEDDNQFAKYVHHVLARSRNAAYEIVHLSTLGEAVRQLGNKEFDLVLLDLGLKDSHGLDTLKAMRKANQSLPILVITGKENDEMGKQAFHFGATGYLHKTDLTPKLLISTIQYTLERFKISSQTSQYQQNLEKMVQEHTRELQQANFVLENEILEHRKTENHLKQALDRSQEREKEVKALLKGAHAILTHRQFPVAARKVFDVCRSLVGATAGYVALLSENGDENEVVFLESGDLPCDVDPNLPMPIRGLREEAYQKGETVFNNDFMSSPYAAFMPKGHVILDNVLFSPLKIEGRAAGVMGLANKPGGFTENDAKMASAFGEIAAIALKNSWIMEALTASENQFRSLVETCPDPIVIYDTKGNVQYVNKSFSDVFGWKMGELISSRMDFFVPRKNRRETRQHLERMLAGEKVVNFETRRTTKTGQTLDIEISAAMFRDDKSRPMGSAIFFRDITQRKLLEKKIRQNERNLRKILESTYTAMVVVDAKTHCIEYVNTTAADMIGLSKDKILGKICRQFFSPADPGQCPVTDLGQRVDNSERVLLQASGERLPIIKTASAIRLDNKDLIIESFIDITEMKKAEEERISRKRLQAAIETAGAACHELNQPLQTIMNLAEAILEETGKDHPLYEELSGILNNTYKMAGITQKLNNLTTYQTTPYSEGTNILDLPNSSET